VTGAPKPRPGVRPGNTRVKSVKRVIDSPSQATPIKTTTVTVIKSKNGATKTVTKRVVGDRPTPGPRRVAKDPPTSSTVTEIPGVTGAAQKKGMFGGLLGGGKTKVVRRVVKK
jgi:hypothetical protein